MKNKEAIEELRDEVVERRLIFKDKMRESLSQREECARDSRRDDLQRDAVMYSALGYFASHIEKKLDKILKEWE